MAKLSLITGLLIQGFLLTVFTRSSLSQEVKLLNIAESCSANFITLDYKANWEDEVELDNALSPSQWDISFASKSFVYLAALNLFKTYRFEKFDETHFHKSCLLSKRINGWGVTNTTGYGKHFDFKLVPTTTPKVYQFFLRYGPNGPTSGTASIILSDNKSFNVFEFCHSNGLRTFAVFSRGPASQENLSAIKLHLKALGFKERHFLNLDTGEDVESCVGSTDEHPVPAAQTILDPYWYHPGFLSTPLYFLKK